MTVARIGKVLQPWSAVSLREGTRTRKPTLKTDVLGHCRAHNDGTTHLRHMLMSSSGLATQHARTACQRTSCRARWRGSEEKKLVGQHQGVDVHSYPRAANNSSRPTCLTQLSCSASVSHPPLSPTTKAVKTLD